MIRTWTGWRRPAASAAKVAGSRRATGDGLRVVHLRGSGGHGHVQLVGQLIGGELLHAALTGIAGGELTDRGHHVPRGAGFQPAARGDDADQLVIRQPGQALPGLAGDGVDDRGKQRIRRHVRSRAGLGKLIGVQGTSGQAQEQALPRRFGVRLGWRRGAGRLLAVIAWVGERVRAHAPRSVRKKDLKHPVPAL